MLLQITSRSCPLSYVTAATWARWAWVVASAHHRSRQVLFHSQPFYFSHSSKFLSSNSQLSLFPSQQAVQSVIILLIYFLTDLPSPSPSRIQASREQLPYCIVLYSLMYPHGAWHTAGTIWVRERKRVGGVGDIRGNGISEASKGIVWD